jgi:hypothetical protein
LRLTLYQAAPGSADETALALLSLGSRDPLDTSASHDGSPSAGNVTFPAEAQQDHR